MSVQATSFVHINYDPLETDINAKMEEVRKLYEYFKEQGKDNVTLRIFSYYYEGMYLLLQADNAFLQKEYQAALRNYEEANKLIVRARASRGVEKDAIAIEMRVWEFYSKGKTLLSEGLLEKDIDEKIEKLEKAIEFFDEFSKLRINDPDKIFCILAKLHLKLANYYVNINKARKYQDRSHLYKKHLLYARTNLTPVYYFSRLFENELIELQNEIDDVTKNRIIARADWYWNKGSEYIGDSNFKMSGKYFGIASKYYTRASDICSDFLEQRFYLALSKITLASQLESKGNELYKLKDEPKEASKVFLEAMEIVDEALGLLATIKNEYLIKSMTAQRAYYEALAKQTEGIYLFDNEKFSESLKLLEESLQKYNEATVMANENKLEILLAFISRSKSEVEGYISMAKAML